MVKKLDIDSLNKKEKKEYVKNLKKNQNSKDRRMKLIFTTALLLLIILAGFGLYTLATSSDSSLPKELGQKISVDEKTGQLHINLNEAHAPYTSNPPTSGPHYNIEGVGPIECKFYDTEVVDEAVIHNLEHGAVWITYKNNDAQLKSELKQIVDDNSKILVSYRPKNDSFLALAAWGRLLKLDTFDKIKLGQFIKLYKNGSDAPEPLAGCGTQNKT